MVAAVQNLSQAKLPPTERDLELYRSVTFDKRTTREAATSFGVSQTRVRQVVTRVVEFLVQGVPEELPKANQDQRLYVAEQLARLQLEHLYGKAMEMWRQSQQPAGQGRVCYLNQAMRIAVALAKVPVRPLPEFRCEEEGVASPSNSDSPPVGDCSEIGVSRGSAEEAAPVAEVANNCGDASCDAKQPDEPLTDSEFSAPAQTEPNWARSVEELRPDPLHPSAQNKPNRKERRARERLRQKWLARQKAK